MVHLIQCHFKEVKDQERLQLEDKEQHQITVELIQQEISSQL